MVAATGLMPNIVVRALTALAAVLFVSPLRSVFNLSRPHLMDLAVCAAAAAGALAWAELIARVAVGKPHECAGKPATAA
jgi:hypothetical protein